MEPSKPRVPSATASEVCQSLDPALLNRLASLDRESLHHVIAEAHGMLLAENAALHATAQTAVRSVAAVQERMASRMARMKASDELDETAERLMAERGMGFIDAMAEAKRLIKERGFAENAALHATTHSAVRSVDAMAAAIQEKLASMNAGDELEETAERLMAERGMNFIDAMAEAKRLIKELQEQQHLLTDAVITATEENKQEIADM